MSVFLSLIAIIGFASQLRFHKLTVDTSITFTVSTLIIILFIAGYFSVLDIATNILMFTGFILFLRYFLTIFNNKEKLLQSYDQFFFFIILSLLFFILTRTDFYSLFNGSDNFSHWARATKIIMENNRFFIGSDPIFFPDYPPGTALYNYFFLLYSENNNNNLMFAQGTLSIALISPFFKLAEKRLNFWLRLLSYIFLISTIYFFYHGLHTLTADIVLSLLFAINISAYLVNRYNSSRFFDLPIHIQLEMHCLDTFLKMLETFLL